MREDGVDGIERRMIQLSLRRDAGAGAPTECEIEAVTLGVWAVHEGVALHADLSGRLVDACWVLSHLPSGAGRAIPVATGEQAIAALRRVAARWPAVGADCPFGDREAMRAAFVAVGIDAVTLVAAVEGLGGAPREVTA